MTDPDPRGSVLFVCLGNICRSPTAEAVMNAQVAASGLSERIVVDSAGTTGYHAGEPADGRMRDHAERRGYLLTSIARSVRDADFASFDLIVAMDSRNLRDLNDLRGKRADARRARPVLMSTFLPPGWPENVPDPYHGGAAGFETVLDMIEAACPALLRDLVAGPASRP